MDKRLQKRHKRQVARAKEHVKLSEPDLRTPEQIQAAREASGSTDLRGKGTTAQKRAPSFRNSHGPTMGSASKTDASG
jgi:hypothetical protein